MNHMDTVDDTDTDLVDILPIYHPIWGICENNSCHKQTRYRCGECLNSFYCSKKCQRKHWKKHKECCNHIIQTSQDKNNSIYSSTLSNDESDMKDFWSNNAVFPMQSTTIDSSHDESKYNQNYISYNPTTLLGSIIETSDKKKSVAFVDEVDNTFVDAENNSQMIAYTTPDASPCKITETSGNNYVSTVFENDNIRLVMEFTGCSLEDSKLALQSCGGNLEHAIEYILNGDSNDNIPHLVSCDILNSID